jgi:MYXO-CTERM domain-containing protein
VTVTFDATGLTAGTYEGALCVNSNDPDEPTVAVALTLVVTEEPPPVDYDLYLPVVINAGAAGQAAVPAAVLLGGLLLIPLWRRRR